MKYMLLIYANEADVPNTPEEQEADPTTLRIRNGKTLLTDGPFAEPSIA